jgi:hypothetical protein
MGKLCTKIISIQISEQKILMRFLSHNIPKRNRLAEKISQKNSKHKFLFLVTAAIMNGGRGCRTQPSNKKS